MLENHNVGLGPLPKETEYGSRQPEVTQAMLEGFNWLVREGHLIPNPQQPSGDWFTISRSGEKLLQQYAREEQWEKLGVDVVKHDLLNGGIRFVGGPLENREAAMEWMRRKENKASKGTTNGATCRSFRKAASTSCALLNHLISTSGNSSSRMEPHSLRSALPPLSSRKMKTSTLRDANTRAILAGMCLLELEIYRDPVSAPCRTHENCVLWGGRLGPSTPTSGKTTFQDLVVHLAC